MKSVPFRGASQSPISCISIPARRSITQYIHHRSWPDTYVLYSPQHARSTCRSINPSLQEGSGDDDDCARTVELVALLAVIWPPTIAIQPSSFSCSKFRGVKQACMAPNRYDRQQVDRMDVDMLYYPQVLCLLFQIVIHFVFLQVSLVVLCITLHIKMNIKNFELKTKRFNSLEGEGAVYILDNQLVLSSLARENTQCNCKPSTRCTVMQTQVLECTLIANR